MREQCESTKVSARHIPRDKTNKSVEKDGEGTSIKTNANRLKRLRSPRHFEVILDKLLRSALAQSEEGESSAILIQFTNTVSNLETKVRHWGKKGATCPIKRDLGNFTIEKLGSIRISRFRPSDSNIPGDPLIPARGGFKDPTGSRKENSSTLIPQSCEHPHTDRALPVFRGHRAFVRRERISYRIAWTSVVFFFFLHSSPPLAKSRGKNSIMLDRVSRPAMCAPPLMDVLPERARRGTLPVVIGISMTVRHSRRSST